MWSSKSLQQRKIDAEEFPHLCEVLTQGLSDGVAPSIVAGIWQARDPDVIWSWAGGDKVTEETLFDVSSVSKIIATAPLIANLVQRGWLAWDTRVKAVLPAYPFGEIEIGHLLNHSSGLVWWRPFFESMQKEFRKPLHKVSVDERQARMATYLFAEEPLRPPGEKIEYSDLGFMLLALVVEELTGCTFDQAVERWLWEPMGMSHARYFYTVGEAGKQPRKGVAPTETSSWRGGVLQGQVHDENCWAMGGYGGHAGVFAPLRDLVQCVRQIYGGAFDRAVLSKMWRETVRKGNIARTHGWDMPGGARSLTGKFLSKESVGHWGFTGTSLWVDIERETAIVLLTNRVCPTRENQKIRTFRPSFHNAVAQEFLL